MSTKSKMLFARLLAGNQCSFTEVYWQEGFMQVNIRKTVYFNCGKRYEDMIDHRSYTQLLHISSCEIITVMINLSCFYKEDLC